MSVQSASRMKGQQKNVPSLQMSDQPITLPILHKMKGESRPITMVTAYDYPTAKLADQVGVDMILVGDSLGMVVLGYDSTIPVTLDDIIHHTKAVSRGTKRAFVVADLPFLTVHLGISETLRAAGRLMQEAAAKSIKVEGGREIVPQVKACVEAGIPVMGHLGLTPQSVHQLGGYRVQGKDLKTAEKLLDDALALQEVGAYAIVLECVPETLSQLITERLVIPTIGIGSGAGCDGQVLVFHDLMQFASEIKPKFVKSYANLGTVITEALAEYIEDVQNRAFPAPEHSFSIAPDIIEHLKTAKS